MTLPRCALRGLRRRSHCLRRAARRHCLACRLRRPCRCWLARLRLFLRRDLVSRLRLRHTLDALRVKRLLHHLELGVHIEELIGEQFFKRCGIDLAEACDHLADMPLRLLDLRRHEPRRLELLILRRELRGAIPIGVAHGLDYRIAIAVSILGNLVPVPFIVRFIRKIFAWLRTKSERLNGFVTRMEQRALKKSDTVRRARFWGLFLFVAIPLPGTGAWTGSLIAAMLEMRVKEAFPPIALGVVTAGIIVAVVTYGAASLLF